MELNTKFLFKFSLYILCSVLTMQAFNIVIYKSLSIYIILMLVAGPISAIVLFKRQNWLRATVAVFAFSGLSGLVYIGENYARLYLYGNALHYQDKLYFYHGIISLIFLLSVLVKYHLTKTSP